LRRAYVVGGIGILVLVASCSGKPNDLRHYATQEPVTTTATPDSGTTTAAPTTTPPTAALATQVAAVVMTDASVSEIGFHPSQPRQPTTMSTLTTCDAPLGTPVTGARTGWIGASAVTKLTDYVAAYQGTTGAQVLATAKHALTCGTVDQFSVPAPTGVDSYHSWCEQTASCTVLLAKGNLFSVVKVVTTSEAKAQNLIKDVTPPAAALLANSD
jgi:hypothetical protein